MRLRLECRGVVQGVGFRPALARLAGALGVTGTALNVAGAVHLDLWGERQALETLLLRLPGELPKAAQLEPLQPQWSSAAGVAPEGLTIGSGPASPLTVVLVQPLVGAAGRPEGHRGREVAEALRQGRRVGAAAVLVHAQAAHQHRHFWRRQAQQLRFVEQHFFR
jgi:acylphosphatase